MPTTTVVKQENDCSSVDATTRDVATEKCAAGVTSSPPSSSSDGVVTCAGCERVITDRFFLQAVDRKWHVTCLTCSVCMTSLDTTSTCYARDGTVYCKEDYYRFVYTTFVFLSSTATLIP